MKLTREVKRSARSTFGGSDAFFNTCWWELKAWIREGSIDEPLDEIDVDDWLAQIAAEKVNNPRSRFYIYG